MTASESWDNFEMLRENIFKRISSSATSSCALDLKGNKFLYITIWNEEMNLKTTPAGIKHTKKFRYINGGFKVLEQGHSRKNPFSRH